MAETAVGRGDNSVVDQGLEIREFALTTVFDEMPALLIDNAGGIISPVFKTPEALQENRNNATGTRISYNTTHNLLLLENMRRSESATFCNIHTYDNTRE
jgi:hypothetical protein